MRIGVLMALVGAFALSSCSRGPTTPAATVEAYLNAGKKDDKAAAYAYVQEKDRKFIEDMEKQMGKFGAAEKPSKPEMDFSYKIVDEEIFGDTATVRVAFNFGGKEHTQDMRLVREGGQWKLDLITEEQFEAMSGLKRLTEAAKSQAAKAKEAVSDEDLKKLEEFMKSLGEEEKEEEESKE